MSDKSEIKITKSNQKRKSDSKDEPNPKKSNDCNLKKKIRDNQKHERRKPQQNSMIINGKEVKIAYVEGFPVKKEDADRLRKLKKQMISKGLPGNEIKTAMKLERRKAEKAFAREKKKVCFNCRKSGHNLSECPQIGENNSIMDSTATGICFKCGSTEHTHFECKVVRGQEFKFAQCFVCREQGHIARQCPNNTKGLYPKGGACNVCGDVNHLKRDCPKYKAQQNALKSTVVADTLDLRNPEALEGLETHVVKNKKVINKVVKF